MTSRATARQARKDTAFTDTLLLRSSFKGRTKSTFDVDAPEACRKTL